MLSRSEIMSRIRSTRTGPELAVLAWLRMNRLPWNYRFQPDSGADFEVGLSRVQLYVHGCFWHGCPKHFKAPKTRQEFWGPKIANNIRRDARNLRRLRKEGYPTMVIWEHDFKRTKDGVQLTDKVVRRLEKIV